jgi:hypothetical protein
MAQNSINFANSTYVDDGAVSWNKRGATGQAAAGIDGHAAPGAFPTWIERPRRNTTRKAIFIDDTDVTGGRVPTFRKYTAIIYTAAAYAALVVGTTTVSVPVPGLATSVTYNLRHTQAEKKETLGVSRPGLPD